MHDDDTKTNAKASTNDAIRELNVSEIDEVSGGIYIPLVMAHIQCAPVIRESTGEVAGWTCRR